MSVNYYNNLLYTTGLLLIFIGYKINTNAKKGKPVIFTIEMG